MNRPDHPWKQPQTNHPKAQRSRKPEIPGPGEIPVEKLQAAFRKSGLSKCEVARRLGWMKHIPNVHRLNETLGLEPSTTGKKRKRVTYQTALRLCEALGASPIEMGI